MVTILVVADSIWRDIVEPCMRPLGLDTRLVESEADALVFVARDRPEFVLLDSDAFPASIPLMLTALAANLPVGRLIAMSTLTDDDVIWSQRRQGVYASVQKQANIVAEELPAIVSDNRVGNPIYRLVVIDDLPNVRAKLPRQLRDRLGREWEVLGVDLRTVTSQELNQYAPHAIILDLHDQDAAGADRVAKSRQLLKELKGWDPGDDVCMIYQTKYEVPGLPVQDNVFPCHPNAYAEWCAILTKWVL